MSNILNLKFKIHEKKNIKECKDKDKDLEK